MITLNDIKKAKANLNEIIQNTPLTFAPNLSKEVEAEIYLKKENLQITGSFKIRGAFNKVASLTQEQKKSRCCSSKCRKSCPRFGFFSASFWLQCHHFYARSHSFDKGTRRSSI